MLKNINKDIQNQAKVKKNYKDVKAKVDSRLRGYTKPNWIDPYSSKKNRKSNYSTPRSQQLKFNSDFFKALDGIGQKEGKDYKNENF